MRRSEFHQGTLSGWFLDSLDTAQRAEGSLRSVRLGLLAVLQSPQMVDEELRVQLERLLGGLEQTTGSLTILQTSARNALDEALSLPDPEKVRLPDTWCDDRR